MRYLAGSLTIAVVSLGAILLLSAPPPIPSFAEVRASWRPSAAQLLDRHGNVLYQMRFDAHARRLEWTPLAEISPAIEEAVIASEDRRFFVHNGVDLRALAAAIISRGIGRHGRGASTIAMQLATMLDPAMGRGGHRSVLQK